MIMSGRHLDYESQTSYRLTLVARDCVGCGGAAAAARRSAFVTVEVEVEDVNESTPLFPVQHYVQVRGSSLFSQFFFC